MNTAKYTLQEVTSPAVEREWLDLPKRIYRGNRNWVCPLDCDLRRGFDPKGHHPFAARAAPPRVGRAPPGAGAGRPAAARRSWVVPPPSPPAASVGPSVPSEPREKIKVFSNPAIPWAAARASSWLRPPFPWPVRRTTVSPPARKARDFKKADAIRDELLRRGIILEDTREGVKWKKA